MCFTTLLVTWVLVQVIPITYAQQVPQNASWSAVHDVTLIFYKKPTTENDLTAKKLKDLLSAITYELNKFGDIPNCEEETETLKVPSVCFRHGPCPTHTDLSSQLMIHKANEDTHSQISCSVLEYRQTDEHYLRKYDHEDEAERPKYYQVWCFGLLAVGIISLSGLFGGMLWPLMKSKYYNHVMRVLIGLAVGTLCATSAFQLIPQGFGLKENDASYLLIAIVMLGSLWSLFMFEVLCKIIFHQNALGSNMAQSTQESYNTIIEPDEDKKIDQNGLLPKSISDIKLNTGNKTAIKPLHFSSQTSLHKMTIKHLHNHEHIEIGGMAPVAWMIILGDGLHNFIDGMSIGAGFSKSLSTGFTISLAIACEEFPHELGDFAILINSGMKVKKALMYNFLSALTAFAGLVLGILLGELEATTYIFAFSGGLFLYISLTDLMPELNNMIQECLRTSKLSALLVLLEQNCGIMFGYLLLYMISRYPITFS